MIGRAGLTGGFLALAAIGGGLFSQSAEAPARFVFERATDTFEPNALDVSPWVEAPTGKHGFVTVKGDRFVFQDGTPARFFGSQIGTVPKAQLEYAAKRMRRQGINIVRLHGLEFLNDRAGKTSFDYSAAGWDRLDYLIHKLGENGIYMILDVDYPLIYPFKPGDNIPELPKGGPASHAEFFNTKIASILHQRMRDVFTHLNPYTGKRYADDPTLAMVEVLNEDSLFWGTVAEPFRAELDGKWKEWLRRKYRDTAALARVWNVDGKSVLAEGEGLGEGQRVALYRSAELNDRTAASDPSRKARAADQMRFYLELEEKYWSDSREAMRKAGVKVPIAGTNWQGHGLATRVHMLGQSRFNYIDRHGYWDHPQGEGDLRWRIATATFHNLPMVKALDAKQDMLVYLGVGNLVTEKAWEQVLDRPLTVSEWNTCLPNQYSLEGTALMTAYGLLQGWDASMQFGYFSPDFRDRVGNGSFDLFGNHPQVLQFPAAAIMWQRQDVQEGPLVAESLYDGESVFEWSADRKPLPLAAALVGKVGYRFVPERRKPVVKDIGKYWDAENLVARSMTGELTWDGKRGVVHVDTARSQAIVGFLSDGTHRLKDVSLISPNAFGAVYVTAIAGMAPIRSANRLLVTAVGPVSSNGMEYEKTVRLSRLGPQWRLKSAGDGPAMLEAITGELRIRSTHARRFQAWTLDVTGKRRERVALSVDGGGVALKLQPAHKAVYYELAIE